jgi:outer membrane protein assembly factor BamD (BamD/ComL family)
MLVRAAIAAAVMSIAPLQCGGHASDAAFREDDTPGDALWQLAQRFHQDHDAAAERRTLEYLVERYPASRWAEPAREELGAMDGGAGEGG